MSPLKFVSATLLLVFAESICAQEIPRDEVGFTEYVASQLRKEVGKDAVVVKGLLTIGLGELQANLDRVFQFCSGNAAGCSTELDRYVKGAAQVHKERSVPPSKDAVRVVVRTSQYVQATQSSTGGPGPVQTLPRPFVEGLAALPVLDTPRAIKMLGEKDAKALGMNEQEVYDLGIANLRKELKPLMEVAKVAGKGQIGQLIGDSFHPSRLLLLDGWAQLAKEQSGVLIVAIPATDAVFYIGEDTPVAVDALRALVKDVMSRAPNRLSSTLLRYKPSGWEVLAQ
ncbi:hypothetical protein [Polaromonas sp.]|uniref:hypothetical protein n=1 Tax=Polaromonas sp. TaxID=1869339 RepID=UPI0032669997